MKETNISILFFQTFDFSSTIYKHLEIDPVGSPVEIPCELRPFVMITKQKGSNCP